MRTVRPKTESAWAGDSRCDAVWMLSVNLMKGCDMLRIDVEFGDPCTWDMSESVDAIVCADNMAVTDAVSELQDGLREWSCPSRFDFTVKVWVWRNRTIVDTHLASFRGRGTYPCMERLMRKLSCEC